jgi:hypothetical protein
MWRTGPSSGDLQKVQLAHFPTECGWPWALPLALRVNDDLIAQTFMLTNIPFVAPHSHHVHLPLLCLLGLVPCALEHFAHTLLTLPTRNNTCQRSSGSGEFAASFTFATCSIRMSTQGIYGTITPKPALRFNNQTSFFKKKKKKICCAIKYYPKATPLSIIQLPRHQTLPKCHAIRHHPDATPCQTSKSSNIKPPHHILSSSSSATPLPSVIPPPHPIIIHNRNSRILLSIPTITPTPTPLPSIFHIHPTPTPLSRPSIPTPKTTLTPRRLHIAIVFVLRPPVRTIRSLPPHLPLPVHILAPTWTRTSARVRTPGRHFNILRRTMVAVSTANVTCWRRRPWDVNGRRRRLDEYRHGLWRRDGEWLWLRRRDRNVRGAGTRRLADDFSARVAPRRLMGCATSGWGVIVSRYYPVGDYDVFFLLDFDETHGGIAGPTRDALRDSWGLLGMRS